MHPALCGGGWGWLVGVVCFVVLGVFVVLLLCVLLCVVGVVGVGFGFGGFCCVLVGCVFCGLCGGLFVFVGWCWWVGWFWVLVGVLGFGCFGFGVGFWFLWFLVFVGFVVFVVVCVLVLVFGVVFGGLFWVFGFGVVFGLCLVGVVGCCLCLVVVLVVLLLLLFVVFWVFWGWCGVLGVGCFGFWLVFGGLLLFFWGRCFWLPKV